MFLDSVQQSAGFHAFGRFYLRQLIKAMLVHRLKLVDLLGAHPEILEQDISRPLFVLGLPRSGTTLLFNLLAQDPRHRYMPNWETFIGQVAPPGNYSCATDPRRKQAKWMLRLQKLLMPDLDKVHEFTPGGPEECTPILMQGFATQALAGNFDAPTYSSWLDEVDHDPTYRHHKTVLQALQWKYPGERWLLKSPDHLSALASLMKTYPDACCVHIHRDPAQSGSDWASLNQVYREVYYQEIDTDELGRQVLNRLAADLEAYTGHRDTVNPAQFHNIQYRALVADPIDIIRQIYDHFDFHFNAGVEERMRAYMADHPANKLGVHEYKPADFGLTENMIHQRCKHYIDPFSAPASASKA